MHKTRKCLFFDQDGQLVVAIGNIVGEFYSGGMWGGDIDAADYNVINGIYVPRFDGKTDLFGDASQLQVESRPVRNGSGYNIHRRFLCPVNPRYAV